MVGDTFMKKNSSSFMLSFEFYPPKTQKGLENLKQSSSLLNHLSPAYFSVTFGAGGSTRYGTIDIVKILGRETKIPVAPHLSCIGFNREGLADILQEYKSLGVRRVVALRGDLPSGMGSLGEFKYASELVELIREETGDYFHIEVAAYPECHPQAKNAYSDVMNLKRKFAAGANSAITQYFFNPDAYFYFLDECAKQHIFQPIVPGIMPVMHFNKLTRFSETCGAEIPRWLYKRLEAYGDDVESVTQYGLEVVYQLCQRLVAGGAPGLHFYTLNHGELCTQIIEQLDLKRVCMQEVTG
jgi:methylenetetrahydrofolate reductase (NADPH)